MIVIVKYILQILVVTCGMFCCTSGVPGGIDIGHVGKGKNAHLIEYVRLNII